MIVNKYYILIAEGITDCSFLEAVLEKYLGFEPFHNVRELPLLFSEMVGKYPTISGSLQRQDSPTFYYKDSIGIAIKQAGGCSKIPAKISLLTELIDKQEAYESFGGFLIFCDTDLHTKNEIEKEFIQKFQADNISYEKGHIKLYEKEIICKLYLFPSSGTGAIEKLLLECTNLTYGTLHQDAQDFRNKIMSEQHENLRKKCWAKKEEIQKFYADKVQFGAVSAVLKPDKPVRFAIKDNLIKPEFLDLYMKLPEFNNLHSFLSDNLI